MGLTKSLNLCYGSRSAHINPTTELHSVRRTIMLLIWLPPTNLFWRNIKQSEYWFRHGQKSLFSVFRIVTAAQIWTCSPMFCENLDELTETYCVRSHFFLWGPDQINFCLSNNSSQEHSKTVKYQFQQVGYNEVQGASKTGRKGSCEIKLSGQGGGLTTYNSHRAWVGVKSMMGIKSKKDSILFNSIPDFEFSKQLNTFYNRFNVHYFSNWSYKCC